MPDISMCLGKNCTIRENCYRYKAIPDSWQYYSKFQQDKDGKCDYYWKLEENHIVIKNSK